MDAGENTLGGGAGGGAGGSAGGGGAVALPSRRAALVRLVMAEFRRLNAGNSQAMVALSGGADSSALLLALAAGLGAARGERLVACHVVHDLREANLAEADAAAARALCAQVGVRLIERRVVVRGAGAGGDVGGGGGGGNLEGAARVARYAALALAAAENGCGVVVTGHHGHDNIETVLMALVRGAGPAAVGGLRPSRRLAGGVRLIRPMLSAEPSMAQRLCVACGWAWREDHTNQDRSRLRAAVRGAVLPGLLGLPGVEAGALLERLVWQGRALRRSGRLLERAGAGIARVTSRVREGNGEVVWARGVLRGAPGAEVTAALLGASRELRGVRGRDALGHRQLGPAVRLVRSASTEPKVFGWKGLELVVTAREVRLRVL